MSKIIPVAIVGVIVIIVSVLFVENDIKEPPSMDVDIKVCSKWAEKVFKEATDESEQCKIAFEKAKKEFDRVYQTMNEEQRQYALMKPYYSGCQGDSLADLWSIRNRAYDMCMTMRNYGGYR